MFIFDDSPPYRSFDKWSNPPSPIATIMLLATDNVKSTYLKIFFIIITNILYPGVHYSLIMALESASDKKLNELMGRVRRDMQQVHEQLDIMDNTLSACNVSSGREGYMECVPAVSTALVEAIKFKDLTVELVRSLDELKDHVMAKHL